MTMMYLSTPGREITRRIHSNMWGLHAIIAPRIQPPRLDMPSTTELWRRLDAFFGRLGSRRAVAAIILFATLLASPSIWPLRAIDDWVLSLIARGRGSSIGLHGAALDL